MVIENKAEGMRIDLTAKCFADVLEAHKDELQSVTGPGAAGELLTTIVKEEKLSKVLETTEDRRRRLRDKMFSSANYFTAGMTEHEIVAELKSLVEKILPMAVVNITLPGVKLVSIAS